MILHSIYMCDLDFDLVFVQVSYDIQIVLLHLFLLDAWETDQFVLWP